MANKEKKQTKLPNAWKSIKSRNEKAQSKTDFKDIGRLIIGLISILAIAFILLGGISQVGLIRFAFDWSENVGTKISNWITGGGIIVNDDGIYIDPHGSNSIPNNNSNTTEDSSIESTIQTE